MVCARLLLRDRPLNDITGDPYSQLEDQGWMAILAEIAW